MTETSDLKIGIMERMAFGIPMKKWLDIFSAVRMMIDDAKKECGGDGMGCKCAQEVRYTGSKLKVRCNRCPIMQIKGVMEAMPDE